MSTKHKTCKRFNDAGHAHALTFSCFHRQPFLSRDRSRQWLVDGIDLARTKYAIRVWAYVIMPEHVHLLIWPTTGQYDISRILATIKQSVTRKALRFVKEYAREYLPRMLDRQPNGNESHRFWQRGGGYDRNVTEPHTVWAQIDYIHANPVRRSLCERPDEWFWSSAADFAGLREGPLRLDHASLPRTIEG